MKTTLKFPSHSRTFTLRAWQKRIRKAAKQKIHTLLIKKATKVAPVIKKSATFVSRTPMICAKTIHTLES
jgi:hypothetical protein